MAVILLIGMTRTFICENVLVFSSCEMSSMINLKSTKKTPSVTIGVNPVTNINIRGVSERNDPNGHVNGKSTDVRYPSPDTNEFVSVTPQASTFHETTIDAGTLQRENEVLRLIIQILQSNPLIVNKYIIADDEVLETMIRLLCNATEVQIDAEDLGEGCLTKKNYRKVHSIYVTVDGATKNLKYDFPAVMKTLKDLCISTKFVW